MADDYFFGLEDKANVNARTSVALEKVERAIEAFREHRPMDDDDRGNDFGFDVGGDDFSSV